MPQTRPAPPAAFPPAITAAARAAALEFFTTSCRTPAAERSADPGAAPTSGVVAVIPFLGDPLWSLALVLPEAAAVAAARGFAGFDIPYDSPDMGDLVGEMANVIAGDVVARLEAARVSVRMALPTVARGQDVELLPPTRACESRLTFSTPSGGFQVRLFQAPVGAAAGQRPA